MDFRPWLYEGVFREVQKFYYLMETFDIGSQDFKFPWSIKKMQKSIIT